MQWVKRERDAGCYDWVLDLDIKGFFDNLSQDLLLRAVKKHAPEQWIVLLISNAG